MTVLSLEPDRQRLSLCQFQCEFHVMASKNHIGNTVLDCQLYDLNLLCLVAKKMNSYARNFLRSDTLVMTRTGSCVPSYTVQFERLVFAQFTE